MRFFSQIIAYLCILKFINNEEIDELNYDEQNLTPIQQSMFDNQYLKHENLDQYEYINQNYFSHQQEFESQQFERENRLLQSQTNGKKPQADPITCQVQTSQINEIICNDINCTSNNPQIVEADISNLEQFSLCFTKPNSVIDLTNIKLKIGVNNKKIILQAGTIKINNVEFSSENNNSADTFELNGLGQINAVNLILNQFSSINVKAKSALRFNGTEITAAAQSFNTPNNIIFENVKLNIQGSVIINSGNSAQFKKFIVNTISPTQTQKQNSITQEFKIISTNNVKILSDSSCQFENYNFYIESKLITITNSHISTKELITLKSLDQIVLRTNQFHCNSAYIYNQFSQNIPQPENQDKNQTSKEPIKQIQIVNTLIQSELRLCKTACSSSKDQLIDLLYNNKSKNFDINKSCNVREYSPIISLLSDSQNGQFSNVDTFKRYNINSYNELIELLNTNFTTVILSVGKLELLSKSLISSSNLGIYANNLTLSSNSKISANSMGCLGTQGGGGGLVDIFMRNSLLCGGSGGSYGSLGGSPISEKEDYNELCAQVGSQILYGNPNYPILEGSGGGGYVVPPPSAESLSDDEQLQYTKQNAGFGGGFIYLESLLFKLDGEVDASGGQPGKDFQYLGSGSGGSVQIHTSYMTGAGLIKSNGGNRNLQGGEGGAGRVKINMTHWVVFNETMIQEMSLSNNVTVEVKSGQPKKQQNQQNKFKNYNLEELMVLTQANQFNNQNGSFVATPCIPGFQPKNNLFACEKCPVGFYKTSYNLEECRPCQNSQQNRIDFSVIIFGKVILFKKIILKQKGKLALDRLEMQIYMLEKLSINI